MQFKYYVQSDCKNNHQSIYPFKIYLKPSEIIKCCILYIQLYIKKKYQEVFEIDNIANRMKKSNEIIIEKLDKSSVIAQINVYSESFNYNGDKNILLDKWSLKHYSNPIESSLIFGAFIDGVLVGLNAFQPVIYVKNKGIKYVLQSCESGVLPNYRGLGVWQKIMEYAVEYIRNNTKYSAIIGFPNYNNSYHGFVKMGWKTLCYMGNLLLISNPSKFFNSFVNKQHLKILYPLLSVQKILIYINSFRCGRFTIDENSIVDNIKLEKENTISLQNNTDYIDYKIKYKNIQIIQLKEKETPIAICLYEVKDSEKGETIIIDKIFYTAQRYANKRVVSSICKFLLRKYPNSMYIRYWGIGQDATDKIFKQLFFIKTTHKNPFIIREFNDNMSNDKWNISFLDLD